ncbi:alpha/beta hydrolase [Rhodoplanes sp. TEM]|uniref:alpha/beta fold hydrolase n=1 Tax=Rhodoplanes TaxID=29407 RepID=UPI0023506858|nr:MULTISPECIES: alpha/beta hydrolase [Rhodoplanes]MDC7982744.1 alpha/beta hydrolase [Rhodoplanes sp. TEM]MDQ0357427.1 pimeloyl-ACP methyl ester carboxylesterase [Rhodoplanes tepidamans]
MVAFHHLTVDADAGAAHVIAAGDGRPVVLLHGLGGLAEEIMAPLTELSATHRVLAVDRPGYGGSSPQPPDRMAPDAQAAWLAQVIDALDADRPVIVAHSFATAIALHYALACPDRVAGLVLLGPFCRPTPPEARPLLRMASMRRLGRPLRWALPQVAPLIAGPMLTATFAPDDVPAHMHRLPFATVAQPGAVLAMAAELLGFNDAMERAADRLHEIACPIVVIGGDGDRIAPFADHGEWLRERLPDCTMVRFRETGHMIHHVRPSAVAHAVDRVLRADRRVGDLHALRRGFATWTRALRPSGRRRDRTSESRPRSEPGAFDSNPPPPSRIART